MMQEPSPTQLPLTGSSTASRAEGASTSRKKGRTRYFQWLMLLFLLGVIYYSFVGNVLSRSTEVPMKIGQLVRYQFETDQQAIPQLRRLYETNMPIYTAYVSHYKGENMNLNLWVGEGEEGEVRKLFDGLTKRIETGEDKLYTDLKKIDVSGMAVYSVKRGDESHYFYQSGKKFVWINIEGDAGKSSQILVDAMRAATGSHEGM